MSGKSHRFCPLFAHRQRLSLRQGHGKNGFFPQRRRSEIRPPAPTGKSGRQPAHSGPADRFVRQKNAAKAQIFLSWMLHNYPNVAPIPGSKNQERISENLGAWNVALIPAEFAALEDALAGIPVHGHRGFVERQGGSTKNWGKKNNAPKSLRPSRGLFLFSPSPGQRTERTEGLIFMFSTLGTVEPTKPGRFHGPGGALQHSKTPQVSRPIF